MLFHSLYLNFYAAAPDYIKNDISYKIRWMNEFTQMLEKIFKSTICKAEDRYNKAK